ncbi:unnamed protein product [Caenorhabditis auriculariae]|uniref:Uncharacterized protein n=1 Tax=Caenorhabditis auriculariae TaxID=2777116 RepID=A0A8S1GV02_9PELO|nr:unnamed protein product [Caenorhabditis auriculariae]
MERSGGATFALFSVGVPGGNSHAPHVDSSDKQKHRVPESERVLPRGARAYGPASGQSLLPFTTIFRKLVADCKSRDRLYDVSRRTCNRRGPGQSPAVVPRVSSYMHAANTSCLNTRDRQGWRVCKKESGTGSGPTHVTNTRGSSRTYKQLQISSADLRNADRINSTWRLERRSIEKPRAVGHSLSALCKYQKIGLVTEIRTSYQLIAVQCFMRQFGRIL